MKMKKIFKPPLATSIVNWYFFYAATEETIQEMPSSIVNWC
jgi:hypothetical protein